MIVIPKYVQKAHETLRQGGFQAYLVGGAIRDSLLGLQPTDWDISTDARPEQVQRLFAKTIPTGKPFGTVTVALGEDTLEVTTMRLEGPYSDSRHPDGIVFTDKIEADLARRDFTINALAYDPQKRLFLDPYRGRRDLRRKRLVAVGDARERFREDPLRMLRLLRFQATLGFQVDKKSRQALQAPLIAKVSPERIQDELSKMLLGKELSPALRLFYTSNLMGEILPELAAGAGISPGASHPYDLLGHAIVAAHFAAPNLHLRWAALLHDVAKPEAPGREHEKKSAQLAVVMLRRLRYANKLISKVETLIAHHMFEIHPHSQDKTWRKFIAQVGLDTAFDLIKLREADLAGLNKNPLTILRYGKAMEARLLEIIRQDIALTLKDLEINGTVLMQVFNLNPGPLIGEILEYLFQQVLADPSLNKEDQLLSLAQNYLKSRQ